MKIAIGCDPNAESMKIELIEEIKSLGHEVTDFGSEDVIYANVIIEVAEAVSNNLFDGGVVLCGTGIGASISANKVPGAYCGLVTDTYQAERAALSNNVNMIALGEQVTGIVTARLMVKTWLANHGKFDKEGRSFPKIKRIYDYAGKHDK